MNLFTSIGQTAITATNEAGRIGMFTFEYLRQLLKRPFYLRLFFKQFEKIGVDSIPIVVLTAFFTGGVLALQSYNGFGNAAIAANSLGSVVALSMLRELGPVLASLDPILRSTLIPVLPTTAGSGSVPVVSYQT